MYQVWTKAEYEDNWKLTECPDIAAVEDIIRANFGKDVSVKVSMPVEFDAKIAIKVRAPQSKEGDLNIVRIPEPEKKQEAKSEAAKDKTEPDKDTGGKSHRKVRRGDETVTP